MTDNIDNIDYINNMIQNNEYDLYINFIPKLLDSKVVDNLINKLCSYSCDPSWLNLTVPRLSISISPKIIENNIIKLIKQNITINIVQKIAILYNNTIYISTNNLDIFINKMMDSFYQIKTQCCNQNNFTPKNIKSEIIFFKIVGLLKKLKNIDSQKIKYILETFCYIFASERKLNYSKLINQLYVLLDYSKFN